MPDIASLIQTIAQSQVAAEATQAATQTIKVAPIGAGIAAGFASVGAGIGIGLIGATLMQSMARQPELMGELRTNALLFAALVEGVALFGLLIGLLTLFL